MMNAHVVGKRVASICLVLSMILLVPIVMIAWGTTKGADVGRPISVDSLKRTVVGECEEKGFMATTVCFKEAKIPCNGKSASECDSWSWVGGCAEEESYVSSDCGPTTGRYVLETTYCGHHYSGKCAWNEGAGGTGVCAQDTLGEPLSCGVRDVLAVCR